MWSQACHSQSQKVTLFEGQVLLNFEYGKQKFSAPNNEFHLAGTSFSCMLVCIDRKYSFSWKPTQRSLTVPLSI